MDSISKSTRPSFADFKQPYKTYDFETLKGFWSYPWRQDLPGHTNLVPGPWGLCANFSGQVVEQHITGIETLSKITDAVKNHTYFKIYKHSTKKPTYVQYLFVLHYVSLQG